MKGWGLGPGGAARVDTRWLLFRLDTTGRVALSRLLKIGRVSDLGSYTQTCTYCIAVTKRWMLCQKAIKGAVPSWWRAGRKKEEPPL